MAITLPTTHFWQSTSYTLTMTAASTSTITGGVSGGTYKVLLVMSAGTAYTFTPPTLCKTTYTAFIPTVSAKYLLTFVPIVASAGYECSISTAYTGI